MLVRETVALELISLGGLIFANHMRNGEVKAGSF